MGEAHVERSLLCQIYRFIDPLTSLVESNSKCLGLLKLITTENYYYIKMAKSMWTSHPPTLVYLRGCTMKINVNANDILNAHIPLEVTIKLEIKETIMP